MDMFDEEEMPGTDAADEVLEELETSSPAQYSNDIVDQAMQRIEEANLFKTLINSQIFAPNSARPEIMAAVTQKIQAFALNQLEILVGLKQEVQEVQKVEVELPFSDTEISVLKMLIAKVLKTDPVVAAQERKPEVVQVQAQPQVALLQPTAPAVKPALATKAPVQKTQTKPVQQPKAPAATAAPKGKRGPRPRKMGMGIPNAQTKVKAMPTVDQQMAVYGVGNQKAVVTTEGNISKKEAQSGENLMSNIIGNLTGGNIVAVDNSNPADAAIQGGSDNVNDRF